MKSITVTLLDEKMQKMTFFKAFEGTLARM